MKTCCANCANKMRIVNWDYRDGESTHAPLEGFACMAFADEKEAIWMVGLNEEEDFCECFVPNGKCPCCRSKDDVEVNMYDVEEIYDNCTVQILRNSATGEKSVGWWRN